MEVIRTHVAPVRFADIDTAAFVRSELLRQGLMTESCPDKSFDLKSFREIDLSRFDFVYDSSGTGRLRCAFREDSMVLLYTVVETFSDWYHVVDASLTARNAVSKGLIGMTSSDSLISKLLSVISSEPVNGLIHYVFTFFSVFDEGFDDSKEIHAKVLAEPSLVDMDDAVSPKQRRHYTVNTAVDSVLAASIKDIDLDSDRLTFVTWASIVTVSSNRETTYSAHSAIMAMETSIQYLWNSCYTQDLSITKLIPEREGGNFPSFLKDTYRILMEAHDIVSAIYSSRLDVIYREAVETSRFKEIVDSLERKLGYLTMTREVESREKARRAQRGTEILLFIVALAQTFPIFFKLPLITHIVVSSISIAVLCVLGLVLINRKFFS